MKLFPAGFRAAAVAAGFKPDNHDDCALFYSLEPAHWAAMFTRNRVAAAPVQLGRELLRSHDKISGVFINSKNANAVTSGQGLRDARQTCDWLRQELAGEFLVMSTGVIGVPLPMDKIEVGVRACASQVRSSVQGDPEATARAIMTTDTRPKSAGVRLEIDGQPITIWGVAKGAGMIHPDMATMLAVILTDAAIPSAQLQPLLERCCDESFHCISVDGDTSTNDTLAVLANGASGCQLDRPEQRKLFQNSLSLVCQGLAQQIAFDGEGARHHVTIYVEGCSNAEQARQMGRTIITSPLVKTAIYGRDANWGRVLAAAGRSGVEFDPQRANLWFGQLQLLSEGVPLPFDEKEAREVLSELGLEIRLRVGDGPGQATLWTCDLSEEYIAINADYRS